MEYKKEVVNQSEYRLSAYATEVKAPDLEFKEKLKEVLKDDKTSN